MGNQPTPVTFPTIATATSSTNPFVIHFDTRNPTTADINYPVQKFWFNTQENIAFILESFTGSQGLLTANWAAIEGLSSVEFFQVDASTPPGTNPVEPTSLGIIRVTGGQVAAATVGANVMQTNSTVANTYAIQIQQAGTSAARDTTKNGVAHFNSAQFTDD